MDNKTVISRLAAKIGTEPNEVSQMIRSLGKVIVDSVIEGDVVAIPSFGQFETKKRLEREAVHPSTGKRILIPPKLSLVFKPSLILKQKINSNSEGNE